MILVDIGFHTVAIYLPTMVHNFSLDKLKLAAVLISEMTGNKN